MMDLDIIKNNLNTLSGRLQNEFKSFRNSKWPK